MRARDPFGLDHPFFRPLWIRVVTVAVAVGWALVEFASGAAFWGTLFLALGLFAAWRLLLRFEPRDGP